MNTLLNSINSTENRTKNDVDHNVLTHSSTSPSFDNLSTIILISILSVLCFLGVVFMIFGPIMRSEAWQHVDNYIFGQHMEDENRNDVESGNGETEL
ncbi:unnamed protein product [Rotaria magnacalcarata]|uniref:Uncharacterized protein n=1 Tax=Rotaria magnacalcarata TaxID=392030 RepID=A0A816NL94_9BILA|nr:unnamed protein product [Rotaria magnacalcarata]CAF2033283.1 unnamed protein product [Rotaria magnacalcarata]CAF2036260.1 unnamed protein product [Rotaria magnacalcarata]CAF2100246.1 unnamed protein product [Rotaria magnacalcarata]CAF3813712.1 unnamed protein product [Rotaria magnacalcarata]